MLTPWKLCMLVLLLLTVLPPVAGRRSLTVHERQWLRVWLAVMAGSLAAWVLPPVTNTLGNLGPYILIDIAVGFVILRHPRGSAQILLGAISVIMVTFSCGALAAKMLHGSANADFYWRAMMLFSWVRLLVLASWGAADVVRRFLPAGWTHRHPSPARGIG